MIECRQIEALLPPYVDGATGTPDFDAVAEHLDHCPTCRQSMERQRAVSGLLRARAAVLQGQAPYGLRTRLLASARAGQATHAPALGWGSRLAAFGAAAALVLAVGGTALAVLTPQSNVLFAAQLALDHLKCFVLDGDDDLPTLGQAAAQQALKVHYGWDMAVPDSVPEADLRLVAVRRCLYGDGWAAHVLYRYHGAPVSLYLVPEGQRASGGLTLVGQDELIVRRGGITYVVVAPAGQPGAAAAVASLMRLEAE
jgi:anti-sigma factor RsiW